MIIAQTPEVSRTPTVFLSIPVVIAGDLGTSKVPLVTPCPPTSRLKDLTAAGCYSTMTALYLALRDFLAAPGTMGAYRGNPAYFTCNHCFIFYRLMIAILSGYALAAQSRLLHLFDEGFFGSRPVVPTASAFCQARFKLQPEFFCDWAVVGPCFNYAHYTGVGFAPIWNGRASRHQ